ncbi:MAG: Na+/H+ antiporter NhaC family protein [Lachnospiraceae bacterium]|nr:Na+/H+ antiporter NhaC family protein [Lachnospiraceae bacterium]
MSTEVKKERIEFRGGMFGLIVPFIVLFAGIIWLSVLGQAMPMAFWVPTLAAILAALIVAKNPTRCADIMIQGMANEMVAIMLMAWFLAGIVAEIMKATGLVQGLIWLCVKIGVNGALFPLITFICGSLLSTATGTALGTVISLAPILYPVGVALGANPPVMLASIVSAAYFGDNIAPVSDTTIASAYSQGVEVSDVVRSRLKYAFSAAAIAAVGFVVFGGMGSKAGELDLSYVGEISPKGLIMLIVPALLIIMMYRGVHLIVALTSAAAVGLILGVASGLLPVSQILVVDMDNFTVGGVIVSGVNSLIDIAVFAMLLMGLINLLDKGGFFDFMLDKLSKYTESPKSAELTVALVDVILCLLTVANSVVIVMEGPIAKRLLVEKHNITPDRSANILDAVSCFAMCLIPYGFAPLLAYMFAGGSGAPVNFSVNAVVLYSFHGWGLGIVMLFSMLTGWGRTFKKAEK